MTEKELKYVPGLENKLSDPDKAGIHKVFEVEPDEEESSILETELTQIVKRGEPTRVDTRPEDLKQAEEEKKAGALEKVREIIRYIRGK